MIPASGSLAPRRQQQRLRQRGDGQGQGTTGLLILSFSSPSEEKGPGTVLPSGEMSCDKSRDIDVTVTGSLPTMRRVCERGGASGSLAPRQRGEGEGEGEGEGLSFSSPSEEKGSGSALPSCAPRGLRALGTGIALVVLLAAMPSRAWGVDILFHADLDGHLARPACEAAVREPPGFAALVGAIGKVREEAAAQGVPPPVAFFGGNALAPGLFARGLLEHEPQAGLELLAQVLAAAGYQAATLGHHDFAAGRPMLERFVAALGKGGVPVVVSNLRCAPPADELCASVRRQVLIEREGGRMGVIGMLSPRVLAGIPRSIREGIELLDPERSVRAATAALRAQGADLIVLLTQTTRSEAGFDEISTLARRLRGPDAPDLILSGALARRDDESAVRLLRQDGAPAVLGSTEGTASLTRVRLGEGAPSGDAAIGRAPSPRALDVAALPPAKQADPAVAALLYPARVAYCARYGKAIGPGAARRPLARSDWLRYVLSVMRRTARAEVALINRDFVKAGAFPLQGPLTRAELHQAMPYSGRLGTARITGAKLAALLGPVLGNNRLAVLGPEGSGAAVKINGRPLDTTRHYRVATISFVAEGGDELLPPDALPFRFLPGAPDVRALVEQFVAEQTGAEDGNPDIDPDTDFGPPASERPLIVAVTDVALDFNETTITRRDGYTAPQLTRAEQRAIKGELAGLLLLRSRLHEADGRLKVLYGFARNQPADNPPVSAETADLVSVASLYNFRGLRDLSSPVPRAAVPDPYARVLFESELTRPQVTLTQLRDFRHAEITATAGAIFTLNPKVRVRAGPGVRRQLLAPGEQGRTRLLGEAGATVDAVGLGVLGPLAPRFEGTLDYVFVDPIRDRESQLKANAKLNLPLLPLLFVTIGLDVYAVQQKDQGWGTALDATVGLRLRLDAAHQSL
jgi:5'-nucleotidase / UDP-sugar diphosphatase